jgi:hypothetical protein
MAAGALSRSLQVKPHTFLSIIRFHCSLLFSSTTSFSQSSETLADGWLIAGLQRCGKSCRLRWINYLRPDLKRGAFSQEEEDLIIELHAVLGNR